MVNNFTRSQVNACFPQECVLCRLPSHRSVPLCLGCEGDLPSNRFNCSICALPLPPTPAPALALDTAKPRTCGACQNKPPAFHKARVPWIYDEHFAFLIGRWKYQKEEYLARLFSVLWLQEVGETGQIDALLPVPLHWRRRWQRGFNQAELLCLQLLRSRPELGVMQSNMATRGRHTSSQAGMNASQRQHNLQSAFKVRGNCEGLRIAIVDDVLTTGATANTLARELRRAGAAYVEVWCIARTPA
jgi:ComF family protein